MALLCILDDGKQDEVKPRGEWYRLLRIAPGLAEARGTSASLTTCRCRPSMRRLFASRGTAAGAWTLQDAGSTNGTYVRVGTTPLRNYSELMIGQGRYRFEAAMAPPTAIAVPETNGITQMPQPGLLRSLVPSLVEVVAAGLVQRVFADSAGILAWPGPRTRRHRPARRPIPRRPARTLLARQARAMARRQQRVRQRRVDADQDDAPGKGVSFPPG